MRKNLMVVAVLAVVSYLVGVEAAKSRRKSYEGVRRQLERSWTSPEARRSRKRMKRRARKSIGNARRQLQKIGN